MLDRLAPETIDNVLFYMLAAQPAEYPGYVNLHAWNEMTNYVDIMALAHTCRYLK